MHRASLTDALRIACSIVSSSKPNPPNSTTQPRMAPMASARLIPILASTMPNPSAAAPAQASPGSTKRIAGCKKKASIAAENNRAGWVSAANTLIRNKNLVMAVVCTSVMSCVSLSDDCIGSKLSFFTTGRLIRFCELMIPAVNRGGQSVRRARRFPSCGTSVWDGCTPAVPQPRSSRLIHPACRPVPYS